MKGKNMNPTIARGQLKISPEVHLEFQTNPQNNNVEQVVQLQLGEEIHVVKLIETSLQAEAVGEGRRESTITFLIDLLECVVDGFVYLIEYRVKIDVKLN